TRHFNKHTESFSSEIAAYFTAHLDMTFKAVLLAFAFCLPPMRLVFVFAQHYQSGFLDTLRTKGISMVHYLMAQFGCSFLTCQLMLLVATILALMVELDLVYSHSMLLTLFVVLVLLSFDMCITCSLHTLILDQTSAVLVSLVLLAPVQYLLLVS